MSVLFSLPHILLPCGWTHHSRNITHPQSLLPCLLLRSFVWLGCDPFVQVMVIRQLFLPGRFRGPLGLLEACGKRQNPSFMPASWPPSLSSIVESGCPASDTQWRASGGLPAYWYMWRNRSSLLTIPFTEHSLRPMDSNVGQRQWPGTQHNT